jgi:hypothetical protein
VIDHQIFSIYLRPEHNAAIPSVVKFGDWDQEAIIPGHTLKMFKTNNNSKWSIPAKNVWLNDIVLLQGVGKYIELNPHLPFIYIPTPDWTHYAYELNKALGPSKVDCVYEGNYCKLK